ncbi:CAP domain-containing protein [Streptomyces lavendofoliae]|uniref:CAP domain-containing protein n=1 Tax=Streptomyces lavendofoliae TaxID=67314 RepID=UPI003D91AB52
MTRLVTVSLRTGDTSPALSGQTLHLINEERRRASCSPLRPLPALEDAALRHSISMAHRNALVHSTTAPDDTPRGWAENIARGYRTPTAVVTAWLDSPGHRRNVLNCAYHFSGLNVTQHEGRTWWTHILTD